MDWKCLKCGKINNGEWCTGCGAKRPSMNSMIDDALSTMPNRANGKQRAGAAKKKSSAPVVVLVVLAILLVLGCAAFAASYFLNNYETSQAQITASDNSDKKEDTKTDKKNKTNDDKTKDDNKNDEPDDEDTEDESKEDVKKNTVSTYDVIKEDVTWYEADNDAKQFGGNLVCINDAEEFEKVCALAQSKGIKVFWVGAKRAAGAAWEKTKWQDNTYINYTKWYPGEPSYIGEDGTEESFLMVFCVDGTWYYNDAQNDVTAYYKGKIGYIVETQNQR